MVLSPFNLFFNADFQKINAEIPFTPSYLGPLFTCICNVFQAIKRCYSGTSVPFPHAFKTVTVVSYNTIF